MNENLYSTTKKRYSVFCVRVCVLYMRICIFVYGKSNQIKSKLQCAHNIYTLGKCVAIAFNTILLAYMRLIDACARSACAVMFNAYFHLFLLYCFPKKKTEEMMMMIMCTLVLAQIASHANARNVNECSHHNFPSNALYRNVFVQSFANLRMEKESTTWILL